MGSVLSLIGLVISIITAVVAVTAMVVQMKTNVQTLAKQDERIQIREDNAARELTELLVMLKSFIAQQTHINESVAETLAGVVASMSSVEKKTVENSTIISLLTEVLKRKPDGLTIAP